MDSPCVASASSLLDSGSGSDLSTIAGITQHGYTFQRALGQQMGLNDMVGRVQDDVIGRFLSADPYVTDPMNTQDWNPYSYVYNNPMTYVDPTGFEEQCDGHHTDCPSSTIGITVLMTGTRSPPPLPPPPLQNPFGIQPSGTGEGAVVGAGRGSGGNATKNTQSPQQQSNPCASALKTAGQNQSAIARANAAWGTLQAAAQANGINPALLAAIGVRESGFQNVWQSGNGWGAGVFQIDLSEHPNVTVAQAFNVSWAANYAAGMLAGNESVLSAEFTNFTAAQLLQATAASYNLGVGGISGNPSTIDVGTPGGNYGSNVAGLMQCFK